MQKFKNNWNIIIITLPILLFSACGGGSSGSSGGGSPTPINSTATSAAISSSTATSSSENSSAKSSSSSQQSSNQTSSAPNSFDGNIVLGSPTNSSIKLKVYSATQSGTLNIHYGTQSGAYDHESPSINFIAGTPAEIMLNNLSSNTTYYYRAELVQNNAATINTAEFKFHTARPTGSSFRFTIQADSHLDENSVLAQYRQTLNNILTDAPDFHIDLGDTFMTEKHSEPFNLLVQMAPDQATVDARYIYERGNFGIISHSIPLFLVNGNHEGELGWLNNGTANNNAVWASNARQKFYANPVNGSFYSADIKPEPYLGERSSWYSWQWGDALFITLDPYWNSKAQASKDPWNLTLGSTQYQWLANTLAASKATYKFIFIHNLVGGLDGQMRGGVEAAPYFEWGGKELDNSDGFTQKRAGWGKPIHSLCVQYKVTAVFHGHDHLYAKQELDGIIYQEVPQPSAKNNTSGANLAQTYHYNSGIIQSSSGHIRISVSPTSVTSEYVRSWLPANETAQRKNGQVDDTWTVFANH